MRFGRRALGAALSAMFLQGQTISYHTMTSAVLRERLDSPPKKNEEREARLFQMFEQAGCTGERLRRQKLTLSKHSNVICELPGESSDTIVVGAHLDMAGGGGGVVDNWSGASMLVSLYEGQRKDPRRHTWLFIGFAQEESGLVGSRYYAGKLKKDAVKQHRAMINIDSVGMSPAKVWVTRSDPRLVNGLLRLAGGLKMPLAGVNVDQVGNSDSHSFKNRGIPVLDLHSLTQDSLSVLHTEKDQADRIVFDDYQNTYRLVSAFIAFLDGSLESVMAAPAKKKSR